MAFGTASSENGHFGSKCRTLHFAILPALPARSPGSIRERGKPQTLALLRATHTPLRIFRAALPRIIRVHYAPIALNTSTLCSWEWET